MVCLTDTKDIVSLLEYTKARRVGDKTNFLFLESPVRFKSAMSQRVMKKERVVALKSGRSKYTYMSGIYTYIC